MSRCSLLAQEKADRVCGSARFTRGMRRAASMLLVAWAALIPAACTEPVFLPRDAGEDAGEPERDAGIVEPGTADAEAGLVPALCEAGTACKGEGPDAMVEPDAALSDASADSGADAALDAVRAKWVGRYGTRSALFSFDDPVKSSGRLLSVVNIVPNESGGLSLEEELCYYEGTWSFLLSAYLKYTYVNARVAVPLVYDGNGFHTDPYKLLIGYGPTPSECSGATTAAKREDQTWITGSTCDCPRDEAPPASPRDCRVNDPEGDKRPGATFTANIETSVLLFRTTQEERLAFSNGYRRESRLYAERTFIDVTRVLECTVDGMPRTTASCPPGAGRGCPSVHNKVEFVPISETDGCAQVIAQESGLFALRTEFPASCPAELTSAAREGRALP